MLNPDTAAIEQQYEYLKDPGVAFAVTEFLVSSKIVLSENEVHNIVQHLRDFQLKHKSIKPEVEVVTSMWTHQKLLWTLGSTLRSVVIVT